MGIRLNPQEPYYLKGQNKISFVAAVLDVINVKHEETAN
jgi:hypothetical protein